jgi:hypothetical protein
MPLPDGHHEEVKAALVDAVAQIDAVATPTVYRLGPTEAFATHAYKKQYFSARELSLWHAVRAGVTPVEFEMGCGYLHTAEFFVLAAAQFENAEQVLEWQAAPTDGGPVYTKVQNMLLDDLEQAIQDGPSRTASHPLKATAADGNPLVDQVDFTTVNRDFLAVGWCCLEVRLEVRYHTPSIR